MAVTSQQVIIKDKTTYQKEAKAFKLMLDHLDKQCRCDIEFGVECPASQYIKDNDYNKFMSSIKV